MKIILTLTISIILVKSIQTDPNATHYNYQQGIGRIMENYHYLHFYINITSLRHTYNKILISYTILSGREELRNSSLFRQTESLCNEIYQNLQQIEPLTKRVKRGLINGLGTVIKYIFGNPDANDLDKINNYLTSLERQQHEGILTLGKTVSIINTISNTINGNTEMINKNLQNLANTLSEQSTRLDLFEAIITLITQEQHFLNLLEKIKRSFVFSGEVFDLEILTYEQMSDIKAHLLKLYSRKELMLHYHNLLDFRFTQGSIVTAPDFIIYTLKIPILNPIEFSLFQRLATISHNNQTEIITTPWKLTGTTVKLFAHKCQLIYDHDYLCYRIVAEEIRPIYISTNIPLVLVYPLSNNSTLISCNYPITIEYNRNKTTLQGTHFVQGNDVQVQGHNLNENLGELKQPEILPLIIRNYQLNLEPLKTLTSPTIDIPTFQKLGIEFHMSVTSVAIIFLIIIGLLIHFTYRKKGKIRQPTQTINNEDVIELRQGGVM
ncbi:uncharacterized protein LOC143305748 [Osmia lignaria lignaria]|uniref:uncharacterized protein LOC143305748 n=1 Tax=Osmia lignaria lignaria TaxID=1437193 RepID=UPI00402B559A